MRRTAKLQCHREVAAFSGRGIDPRCAAMRFTADQLWGMNQDALHERLAEGHALPPEALDDTEYRGVSLGLPAWVEGLTWSKFRKCFHRDPSGLLRGWNVRLEQNGLDAPDVPMTKKGAPFTFGHYEVVSTRGYPMPRRRGRAVYCHRGLLLDYGRGDNPPGMLRYLRDPVVAVNAGDPTLLLGWSYLDFGVFQASTPSFFTLQKSGPLSHVP